MQCNVLIFNVKISDQFCVLWMQCSLTVWTSYRSWAGSTQLISRKRRSIMAEVSICFKTNEINPSFFLRKVTVWNIKQTDAICSEVETLCCIAKTWEQNKSFSARGGGVVSHFLLSLNVVIVLAIIFLPAQSYGWSSCQKSYWRRRQAEDLKVVPALESCKVCSAVCRLHLLCHEWLIHHKSTAHMLCWRIWKTQYIVTHL